jgi:hypothetical protein
MKHGQKHKYVNRQILDFESFRTLTFWDSGTQFLCTKKTKEVCFNVPCQ